MAKRPHKLSLKTTHLVFVVELQHVDDKMSSRKKWRENYKSVSLPIILLRKCGAVISSDRMSASRSDYMLLHFVQG